MQSLNHDAQVMLPLRDWAMVMLNTGKHKDISNNEEDAIVNAGEKKFKGMNMINKVS